MLQYGFKNIIFYCRLNDEERESYLNQIPGPFEPEELNVNATGAPAPASPRPQGLKQVVESCHLCYKTAIKNTER